MGTGRGQLKGKSPTSAGAIGCGGYVSTTVQTATEEFTAETSALNIKTITTS